MYPTLGKNVILHSNSKILGDSTIGDNVIVSANTTILNENIPNNSLVFGKSNHSKKWWVYAESNQKYLDKHN